MPSRRADVEALAMAKQIAESERKLVTAYRALIDDGYDSPFGEALKLEDERSALGARSGLQRYG